MKYATSDIMPGNDVKFIDGTVKEIKQVDFDRNGDPDNIIAKDGSIIDERLIADIIVLR